MNILTLNAGSGSQKCALFAIDDRADRLPDEPPDPIWQAEINTTAPGQPPGELLIKIEVGGRKSQQSLPDDKPRTERIAKLLETLWQGDARVIGGPADVQMVGHRVVHGGDKFDAAVWADEKVEAIIEELSAFAPLHNHSNLEGIRVTREVLGKDMLQVAVFDTAFHRTLPPEAATYPGPHEWLDKGIRRYGFHGTSFRWASGRAAALLGRAGDPGLRLILCHLGGGCSLAAVRGGVSIDTTMGFTPLDGIAMCTRSGALDPGILLYLLREGTSVDDLEKMLNKHSGLAGVSGMAGDTRIIAPESEKGNKQARLALDVFVHRLRAGIGSMLASLGGLDALVFTDGISEDEPTVRAAACEPFGCLGLKLDSAKNAASPMDADIAAKDSAVRVLIVKSRENWQIARECWELKRRMKDEG